MSWPSKFFGTKFCTELTNGLNQPRCFNIVTKLELNHTKPVFLGGVTSGGGRLSGRSRLSRLNGCCLLVPLRFPPDIEMLRCSKVVLQFSNPLYTQKNTFEYPVTRCVSRITSTQTYVWFKTQGGPKTLNQLLVHLLHLQYQKTPKHLL